jgi:hypothetical protein
MPQPSIVIDQTAHTAHFFLLPGAWSMTGPPNKQPGSSQPGRMGFSIGEKPGPAGVSERESRAPLSQARWPAYSEPSARAGIR